MPTTKGKLAEQILLRLGGGRIGTATKWHPNEIKLAIEQSANQMLKVEYIKLSLPSGNVIPNGAIATYENILVNKYKNTSGITLPAMPQRLERNIGVYQIFSATDVYAQFIPVDLGIISMIQSQPFLISALSNKILYEVAGLSVYFSKDITTPNVPVYVTVRLAVLDMSQYSDWDILPLPSDMEAAIIEDVYKKFAGEVVADKLVDPGSKEQVRELIKDQVQS